ncbi:hypothetical protein ACQE3D_20720 [Methylomonas sp. MS20]|uniref:hypothetical protein n=1 Tax=unclassified Methylomonas TaxID=2608980 RepID=UPI0028A49F7A|nr:hypothetical protein [Methylomonas sp. MV1]MDT4332388.1 hypothetical protein [Methylomonas sp. MV1]
MFTTQASPIKRRGPPFIGHAPLFDGNGRLSIGVASVFETDRRMSIGGRPVFICGTRVLNTGWPVFESDACLLTKHRSLFALECRLFSGDACVSGMKR